MTYEELELALQRPLSLPTNEETLMGLTYVCAYCYRGFTWLIGNYNVPPCPVRNELIAQWARMRNWR